ncbi:hypothetical protein Tco_0326595 [Tanacetum coccineum]
MMDRKERGLDRLPHIVLLMKTSTVHSSSDIIIRGISDFLSDASLSYFAPPLFRYSYQTYREYFAGPSRRDVSDEPHFRADSDPEVQAEIDECFAYADALRDRGIEARVVVEAIDRDETETGVRGPIELEVSMSTYGRFGSDDSYGSHRRGLSSPFSYTGYWGVLREQRVDTPARMSRYAERGVEAECDDFRFLFDDVRVGDLSSCARKTKVLPSLEACSLALQH